MSAPDPHAAVQIDLSLRLLTQLETTLEQEFAQLRAQVFDPLESLQAGKQALLEQIQQLVPVDAQGQCVWQHDPAWHPTRDRVLHCRRLQQRNHTVVQRQLEAVRGALQALQLSGEGLIEETYTRKGRLAGPYRRGRPSAEGGSKPCSQYTHDSTTATDS